MSLEKLGYYLGLALSNAIYIGSITNKDELLIPFGVFFSDKGVRLFPFEAETQEEAHRIAQETIRQSEELLDGWCYGREGLIPLKDGANSDAYIIEVKLKEMEEPVIFIQFFEYPFKLTRSLVINAKKTVVDNILENSKEFEDALHSGAESHKVAGEHWYKFKDYI
ncbi:hypothetical protein HUF18_08695 [Thalassolituus sp. ST750PaO-4]|uniref:hypothetical protein n=1 Tax=Thalassolituus sp. ST750PaO-4 TaxID=2742965 RepID=UPI001CE2DE6C|nr:hypothetical protein [Thalassolituus sp. ST750PaO-4]MCA6059847.1 hypothetical protein [Thalassolituus sp. ST750PaO-4]